jgi:DNA-binding GntR family transcriptional regulator
MTTRRAAPTSEARREGPSHPRPLQRGSGTALWQQVYDDLRGRVDDGGLQPGDVLPPEPALALSYGVSRLTARRALAELARSGVIRTEHGIGSFVASRMMRHRIDDGQASLLESMATHGHHVRQLVLTSERRPATGTADSPPGASDEYAYFPDAPGDAVTYHYVRWVDDIPWSLSWATVPAALAPPSWDGTNSLFAAITDHYGVRVYRHERHFSAVAADADDAAWLDVPVGAPLLRLRGTNTDDAGRAVAHITHRIRGDRAEYTLRVPR